MKSLVQSKIIRRTDVKIKRLISPGRPGWQTRDTGQTSPGDKNAVSPAGKGRTKADEGEYGVSQWWGGVVADCQSAKTI